MTWEQLITQARNAFVECGIESADSNARAIAEALGATSITLTSEPSDAVVQRFHHLVTQRCTRIPLQHVLGVMYFRYLTLVSKPGCFIVRPETEWMVDDAIGAVRQIVRDRGEATVVDLCTGSGAIALAIATEVPGATVYGVERSDAAFDVACENNRAYGNPVQMIHADALAPLEDLEGRCDVVVTNPPYVPPTVVLSPEVQADPAEALWGGGPDGLDIPRALVLRAHHLLGSRGILVMEHAEEQGEPLREAAVMAGFVEARTGHDLNRRPRWLWARKSEE